MGFSKDTLILMENGTSSQVIDFQIGDRIMGLGDNNGEIISIYESHKKMYKITPIKGSTCTVSQDHILLLKMTNADCICWITKDNSYSVKWLENFKTKAKYFSAKKYSSKPEARKEAKKYLKNVAQKRKGYHKYGSIIKMSVKDYLKLTKGMKHYLKIFSTGIEYQSTNLDIDPYIVGYWLGDGSSSCTGITTAEPEVVEYFGKYAEENNLVFHRNGKTPYGYILTSGTLRDPHGRNCFLNFLKKYDLLNNKYIPDDYKYACRSDRLKLLAGLVDSDGHCTHNSMYDFIFKSEKLADDIIYLARSLGFKAYKSQCQKTCTNGSKGRVTGTYYRFCIYGKGLEKVPSILARKKAHKRKQIKDPCISGFKIEYVGKKTSYNLTSNISRLFLDDFTVVHI